MRDRRMGWVGVLVVIATAMAMVGVGVAVAQNAQPRKAAKGAGKAGKAKGKGKDAGKRAIPNAADPIENADPDALEKGAGEMVHYRLKVRASDGVMLTLVYFPAFPARLGLNAPAVLMVHQKERSSRDFEEPITEIKGQGLAEHLQSLGYAVLAVDLRGHGSNVRKALTPQDWKMMIDDLQAAYQFLVDRHNRGKLNLAKLGVVALGEGANLAAAWANMPGGAVSSEGRTSDLGAMVLISPLPDGEGLLLRNVLNAVAPRIPLLVMVGERDPISADPVRMARPVVERPAAGLKLNRVEVFDTSLHGYKMLWLEPKVPATIAKFLEGTIKLKATAVWEPRYNLTPVQFDDIQLVRAVKAQDAAAKEKAAKEKEKEKEKGAAPGDARAKEKDEQDRAKDAAPAAKK